MFYVYPKVYLKKKQMIKHLHTIKTLFLTLTLCMFAMSNFAQSNRSHDGHGNNLQYSERGAVGTNQLQVTELEFSDGVSEPAGLNRPNPRYISNTIFNQEGSVPDGLNISDYAFAWGQFIDHDITLVGENHAEPFPVSVPVGDPYFDPYSTGNIQIPLLRSASDQSTGTSPDNPRAFPNLVTAFIDASAVYGSDEDRANWLRTFEDGKLKMSFGNLLPYNTTTGEVGGSLDPTAPEMAMANPRFSKWFVAGDVRANENALLSTIHTLFVREHNQLCDEMKTENPNWTDEQIYQRARKIVGAIIQSIVYEEWLPTLGVHLDAYAGYDAEVNPGIMNVFSAAAYRYGHTVINSQIVRMNNEGSIIPGGNISLKDAFFNPNVIPESGGIDPFLIGMGTQVEQDFDCKMIHDLRNFLFGAPGAGGLDLASLNIQRGRERGLADYNAIRQMFDLPRFENFNEISNNIWFNQILEGVYNDINDIDPWVGFLGEKHMDNALFGETVMAIMTHQFQALRDGDRFYYENDDAFTQKELESIRNTSLKMIIMRNTQVETMQENVFLMEAHDVTGLSHKRENTLELTVYPNPVARNFFVNLAAPQAGKVFIQISDIKGVLIDEITEGAVEGMNTFEFDIDEKLPAGFYLLTLVMENRVGHRRIFKK